MPAIPFRKMNGLGNEFIVFDARRAAVSLAPEAIRTLGGESGIGFDQMITIERSPKGADAFMRIHNRDGGEVDACGNATRCIGWLLMGETGKAEASIETNAGLLRAFDTGIPEPAFIGEGGDHALEVEHVSKHFDTAEGSFVAVDDVSVAVRPLEETAWHRVL